MALTAPISFWGGVNPKTGEIADVRHPEHGRSISGRALLIPATVGSSSAAAVLLELVQLGLAPAAIVLHEPDAILLLGLIVAREMGYTHADRGAAGCALFQWRLHGQSVAISADGRIATTTV